MMPLTYGPLQSRRFGYVLGINLLGTGPKVCSMDCVYCDLGPTELRLNKIKSNTVFPSLDELKAAFIKAFSDARGSATKIDSILISGNGEPTLYPYFGEAVEILRQLRSEYLPEAKIRLLTNGAGIDSRKIVEAVNLLDERILKIDAGNEKMFKAINSPLARTTLSSVISNARLLKDFTVQTLFVQGAVDNTLNTDVEDWIEVIGLLRPRALQIHTISRPPARSGLIRVDEDTLYTIASRLERRTQIKSLVFP